MIFFRRSRPQIGRAPGRSPVLRAALVLLAVALISPAAGRTAVPMPETASVCVPPPVTSPARCTFDIYGTVRDSFGLRVPTAYVSEGSRSVTTNALGFFDLDASPGDHMLTVWVSHGCSMRIRVTVDASESLQRGGTRRNVGMPCARPSYNAFGFGVVQKGRLLAVARSGSWHSGHQGDIELFGLQGLHWTTPIRLADTVQDDRDAAGGLTRSGALIAFYARFDITAGRWSAIGYVRTGKDGSTFGEIPAGSNRAFSPYGPLVVLPSGKLLQTFYGSDGRAWRIYLSSSTDDGRTWTRLIPIDVAPPFRATEAAAVYLGGATDATSRILMIARADGGRRPNRWAGLVQYLSPDGGRSWRRLGLVAASRSRFESMPWVVSMPRGRLAVVWADRGSLTIKRVVMSVSDAIAGRWPAATAIYHSRVPSSPRPDIGDFGYPSIVSYGPADRQMAVVFNDVNPAGCEGAMADVDLFVLPLWPAPGQQPTEISP